MMHITNHAISRIKKRGIMPKRTSAKKVKEFIRREIKKCEVAYIDKSTGAKVFVTNSFTAVSRRGTVVTIYRDEEAPVG